MASFLGPVQAIANWKVELLTSLRVVAAQAGWTVIADLQNDLFHTRSVFRSPDNSFYAIFWCNTSALNQSTVSSASAGGGGLGFTIAEYYDETERNLAYQAVFSQNLYSAQVDNTIAFSPTSIASLLSSAGTGTSFGMLPVFEAGTTRPPYTYLVSADANQLIVATQHASNRGTLLIASKLVSKVIDAGTTDPNPTFAFAGWGGSSTPTYYYPNAVLYGGATTRSPLAYGKPATRWDMLAHPLVNPGIWGTTGTTAGSWDIYHGAVGPYTSKVIAARTNRVGANGIYRGEIPGIIAGPAEAVWGDTMVVDDKTYIAACVPGPFVLSGYDIPYFWVERH